MDNILKIKEHLESRKFHNTVTSYVHILKKFPFIHNYIDINNELNFSGQLFCLINNLSYPICDVCGTPYRFVSFKKGFLKFCNNKCDKNKKYFYKGKEYVRINNKILICERHQIFITEKVFQTLINNNVEVLCKECSYEIRTKKIINESIILKTKKYFIETFSKRKKFDNNYLKDYFPYTFIKIIEKDNVIKFKNKLSCFLYDYDLKCKKCGNIVSFNKNGKPKDFCKKCKEKNIINMQYFNKKYWISYIKENFNKDVTLEIKDKKTLIIYNYCIHHDVLEINKLRIRLLKKHGIHDLCVECNKDYYQNKEADVTILKQQWKNIKCLSENDLIFKNPYMWSLINKKMKQFDGISFSEAKYLLYHEKEKPKCNCCDNYAKFSNDSYSYLIHCENHLYDYTTSVCEKEICDWLNNDGFEVERNKRNKIGKELDIYIPNKDIAIEYNGLYWHSDLFKEKNSHYEKWKLCNDRNIKLIYVWEDDWENKNNIIKSIIKNKLEAHDIKICAKQTELQIVNNNDKNEFLINNHLKGSCISSINLGLFYNNELVSIMTFKKIKTYLNSNQMNDDYEMVRFCNKINTFVIEGPSKIFKYFIDNYNPKKIISYTNLDMSNDDFYETLNFKNGGHIGINYWWAKDGIKYNKSIFLKHKLVNNGYDPNKTEEEIMKECKYLKVYGTGSLKYEYENKGYLK